MIRPTWDEYFMNIAEMVKTRSTCLRRHVGAVIVKDKRILSTGYNGAPARSKHCAEIGCIRMQMNVPSGEKHELCRASHAEMNAIAQAAMSGTSVNGAWIYVTCQPCVICSKILINSGIYKIIYAGEYPDALSLSLLKESSIRIVKYEGKDTIHPEDFDLNIE